MIGSLLIGVNFRGLLHFADPTSYLHEWDSSFRLTTDWIRFGASLSRLIDYAVLHWNAGRLASNQGLHVNDASSEAIHQPFIFRPNGVPYSGGFLCWHNADHRLHHIVGRTWRFLHFGILRQSTRHGAPVFLDHHWYLQHFCDSNWTNFTSSNRLHCWHTGNTTYSDRMQINFHSFCSCIVSDRRRIQNRVFYRKCYLHCRNGLLPTVWKWESATMGSAVSTGIQKKFGGQRTFFVKKEL